MHSEAVFGNKSAVSFGRILCIRADNMGDLIMSSPAIRALKDTFGCQITVLTSSMAAGIAADINEIDDVIVCDLPWVKTSAVSGEEKFFEMVNLLRSGNFDAAVIFTVYSQSPLPAAMLAYLAGIPVRVAYCRENPYTLLTHWVPDPEPYSIIRHQVRRDLDLVASIGAATQNQRLELAVKKQARDTMWAKLEAEGVDCGKAFIIFHPGVSEKKREYPAEFWIEAGSRLSKDFQIVITGGPSEIDLTELIADGIGWNAFSLGGKLSIDEFVGLISESPVIVSVNTGSIHLAAAVGTPVVVLYALTNPQHLPWMVSGKALVFDVAEEQRSKNEVIRYVHSRYCSTPYTMIKPQEIVDAVFEVLLSPKDEYFPELVPVNVRY